MSRQNFANSVIARQRTRHSAASRRANPLGDTMSSTTTTTATPASCRSFGRLATALIALLVPAILAIVPLTALTSTEALACACGCSVFDVGGLDTPQEQDHGGRVFVEFWSGDQNQNYVASSRAPAALNTDKEIWTQWYNVGFSYNFDRNWGVMVRVPTVNRSLTTDTQNP